MRKITVYGMLIMVFGFNNTSIFINDIQIPAFLYLLSAFVFFSFINLIRLRLADFKKIIQNEKTNNLYSKFFILVWFAFGLISFFWVENLSAWRSEINVLILIVSCTFAFSTALKTRTDILTAFKIMGIFSIIHNLIGWYEVITNIYLFSLRAGWNGRPVSIFYNTNNLAMYLALSVFILIVNVKHTKSVFLKTLFSLSIISSCALIYFTGSRGGLIGLALGLITYVYVNFDAKTQIKIRKNLIPASIIFLPLGSIFIYRIFFTGTRIVSTHIRLELIRTGFTLIPLTFGRGVGAGNIPHWLAPYNIFHNHGNQMHNFAMEILVAYGIIIFALYARFYWKIFTNNLKKYQYSTSKIDQSLSLSILSILISLIILAAVPSNLMLIPFFWSFQSILIAYQGIEYEGESNE